MKCLRPETYAGPHLLSSQAFHCSALSIPYHCNTSLSRCHSAARFRYCSHVHLASLMIAQWIVISDQFCDFFLPRRPKASMSGPLKGVVLPHRGRGLILSLYWSLEVAPKSVLKPQRPTGRSEFKTCSISMSTSTSTDDLMCIVSLKS